MKASKLREQLVILLPRLRRFTRALTASAHDAEDLTQATLMRALERPPESGEEGELVHWLLQVARHLWIDELRRADRRYRENAMHEQWEDAVPAVTGDPELEHRLTEVEAAMKQIPPDLREVLVHVCVEGYSYEETATRLGIPIGTVMSRLSRARIRLAELMK